LIFVPNVATYPSWARVLTSSYPLCTEQVFVGDWRTIPFS